MTAVLTEYAQAHVVREPRLVERLLVIGGLPGCGKGLLAPILGTLARIEIQKYNEAIEHVCGLRLLGKLDEETATVMIRMLTDLDLYYLSMSREVNLRFGDITSVWKNAGTLRYLRRLYQPGDAAAVERIRREHPILQILLHSGLAISPPLFRALGSAVRLLDLVRHPLHLIHVSWRAYIERYGIDVRDFTLWCAYEGRAVPYFAQGWEDLYLRSNPMDRVIFSIERLLEMGRQAIESLPDDQKAQVLIVPFERFVLDPWPYLEQIEGWLGTRRTSLTRRTMKRQRVPRDRVTATVDRPIDKLYRWKSAGKATGAGGELAQLRRAVATEASAEGLKVLDRLCADYEATYLDGGVRW
ncbi:MAG: hypothetical protein HYY59_07375 [Candidatus Omnitrophica bacterium]|nr:hypothetical protein [Candidatus Omnitrophota bacterium]